MQSGVIKKTIYIFWYKRIIESSYFARKKLIDSLCKILRLNKSNKTLNIFISDIVQTFVFPNEKTTARPIIGLLLDCSKYQEIIFFFIIA